MSKSSEGFKIKFWGTRGSIPTPGPGTVKYGGNTACVEVRCGRELIILDSGSGIRELGVELLKEIPLSASILFSHVHWDHIQGLPFFQPIYIPGNEFKLYGNKNWSTKLEYALKGQMHPPNFPVSLEAINASGAKMGYIDIDSGAVFNIGSRDEITIRSVELCHPNKTFSFRIEYMGKNFVYATDTENLPEPDRRLVELAYGADLLIHDAQYTRQEYYCGVNGGVPMKGRGHSTPEAAAETAIAAKVKKLALFHHDPGHNDAEVDQMLQTASAIFPNTIAVSEGMVIELLQSARASATYPEEIDIPPVCSSVPEAS